MSRRTGRLVACGVVLAPIALALWLVFALAAALAAALAFVAAPLLAAGAVRVVLRVAWGVCRQQMAPLVFTRVNPVTGRDVRTH